MLLLPGQDSTFRGLGSNKLLFFKGNSLSQGFAAEVFCDFAPEVVNGRSFGVFRQETSSSWCNILST